MFSFLNSWGMWGWMSFGLVLMILELFIPGTFIVWFGFGAVATGLLLSLFDLSATAQIGFFALFSSISVFFGFFVYKKLFGANKQTGTEERVGAKKYIGQSFKVVEPIIEGTGKIAVGDTVWLAKSDKDIAKGKMVKVVDVKGTILIVE